MLSFKNLSDDKSNTNLADGMRDDLLTALARTAHLKVVSRSFMQDRDGEPHHPREVGHQLGVAYIVEGTVRQVGRKVRISAQLIDARTDLHQWADTYETPD